MKKTIKVVMALVMVMMLSVTAFAAPSPSGSASVKGATDVNGDPITVNVADSSVTLSTADLKAALGSKYKEGMTVLAIKDVTADLAPGQFPATVVFNSPASILLHLSGDTWEDVTVSSDGSTITGKFNSFSPVAFIGVKTDAAATATTSQKTNESAIPYVIGIVAVLAIAGVAVLTLSKKKKA
ncbi:hypothetical protein M2150_000923 [Lachnospiraceae bacterium PM6-15]|uniref:hypothetical protein n=1 Tax=Ohessyouella blattaphilus TaxID=2949333 RepID=UPI003E2A11B1